MRTRNLAIALAATLIGVSAASLAQTESQKAAKPMSEQPRTTPQPAPAMAGGSRAVATEDAPTNEPTLRHRSAILASDSLHLASRYPRFQDLDGNGCHDSICHR